MRGFLSNVLSCLERERLEEELSEARIRARNLSRLRRLTRPNGRRWISASRQLRRGSGTTTRSTVASGSPDGAQTVLGLDLRRSEERFSGHRSRGEGAFLATLGMTG